jgi:O-antigen ligase
MRFYQLMYEYSFYRAGGTNASGHTLLMKFEFWKAGLSIAMSNPWLGVGIGDVPDEFKSYYQKTNSWLSSEWRMTCHNQYLYFAIAGGIPMLFLFLYFLLTPVAMLWAKAIIPFRLFIGIVLLSMVTEDMLTTQAGVSLVAFFLSFFSFGRFVSPNKEKPSST